MRDGLDFWLVCDSDDVARKTLAKQLKDIGVKKINQYSSIEQLLAFSNTFISGGSQVIPDSDFTGLICSVSEGIVFTCRAISVFRKAQPNCIILVTVPKISNQELSQLVQAGMSHIIINPFNQKMLQEKIKQAKQFQDVVREERRQLPAKMEYKSWVSESPGYVFVRFSGWITENSKLPKIKKSHEEQIVIIDGENIAGINSVGLRLWVIWVRELEDLGFSRIEFENLHSKFLWSLSIVKGHFTPATIVNSFYLIYYCEEKDSEIEIKLVRGKNYDDKIMNIPDKLSIKDSDKPHVYEYDVSNAPLLQFFKGKIQIVEILN